MTDPSLSVVRVTVGGMTELMVDTRLDTVRGVVDLMRADLGARLTLGDLADASGYSPFHLARVFRSVTGIPPGEFRTALRFDEAKRLMITEGAGVTDACFAVGFDSLGTFSARFKRLVGVGPQEFVRLPDVLDRPASSAIARRPESPSRAVVHGRVHAAAGTACYVGLFPHAVAQSRPVTGQYLPRPGAFELAGVPPGRYRLLAAGIGPDTDPLARLVPDDAMTVGAAPEPVVVRTGTELVHRDVLMRPRYAHEPPVVIALAVLA